MDENNGVAFNLPKNDQSTSRLVQLPAELLTKVLRMLLRHDTCLPLWKSWQPSSENYEECPPIELSSQMLSTCQVLYWMTNHILYKENTIPVSFDRPGASHLLFVTVLDATVSPSYRGQDYPEPPSPGLYDLGQCFDPGQGFELGPRDLACALALLARFGNVSITFAGAFSYLIASRFLRPYVRNKHVTVDLGSLSLSKPESQSLAYRHLHQPHFSAACFSVWQCQSIIFIDGCRDEDCNDQCYSQYAQLANIITDSKTRPRDLFPDLCRLAYAVMQIPRFDWAEGLQQKFSSLLEARQLMHSVYYSDVNLYNDMKRQVVAKFDRGLIALERLQWQKIQERATAGILEIEESLDIDEEERIIWVDHVVLRQEAELVTLDMEAKEIRRLLFDLVDEDGLMADQISGFVSEDATGSWARL